MPPITMTTSLEQRLASDLEGTFTNVITTYQDGIYSGVRQLAPTPTDAEDLTQETFVRAYRALEGYDTERIEALQLRAWLWTIALNLCRNAARSRTRRPSTVTLDTTAEPTSPDSVEDEALDHVFETVWKRRLDRLTVRQRTAVVLRHIADLSYREIATATGRVEGSVKSDVHRGLEQLRAVLLEEGPGLLEEGPGLLEEGPGLLEEGPVILEEGIGS